VAINTAAIAANASFTMRTSGMFDGNGGVDGQWLGDKHIHSRVMRSTGLYFVEI